MEADPNTNALAVAIRSYNKKQFNVAFCNFARNHDNPQDKDDAMSAMFTQFAGSKKLSFQIMTAGNFRKISEWADIIYMPGGDPAL